MLTVTSSLQQVLPQQADIAFFQDHGWWLSPVVLSSASLKALREAQDEFYDSGRQRFLENVPAGWQQDRHRSDALRKNDFTALTNDVFMKHLVTHPFIGAAAGLFMEVDAVRLWHDQLLYKPGRNTTDLNDAPPVVGWHTDQSYWKTCTGPMITAWVPFTDCPESMGPIAMLDHSNHWSSQGPDQSDFFRQDVTGQLASFQQCGHSIDVRPMAMKAGQISIIAGTRFMVHLLIWNKFPVEVWRSICNLLVIIGNRLYRNEPAIR